MISKNEALDFLPLATMKDELRIPAAETSHDVLLTGQVCAAVSFVSIFTDRPTVAELDHAALRSAAIILVRNLYDGGGEIGPNASFAALMRPFKSYERG